MWESLGVSGFKGLGRVLGVGLVGFWVLGVWFVGFGVGQLELF